MSDSLSAGFSIDVTQLKAGLMTANKLIRESQSAYRAAAAEIEAAGDKTEGYERRSMRSTAQLMYSASALLRLRLNMRG